MRDMFAEKKGSIYVVDADYKLVYFNDKLKDVFPNMRVGDKCYEELCHEDSPCLNCPLDSENGHKTILYNHLLHRCLEVVTDTIDWPGVGRCSILLSRTVGGDSRNLFYNLTALSAYDELIEINMTRDTYRILYHQEGKYAMPAMSGKFSVVLSELLENVIHPDDREAFAEFCDLDSLMKRLEDNVPAGGLRGQFRLRMIEGGWNWCLETVVPLRQGENDDQIIMCFIQNIDEEMNRELSMLHGGTATVIPDPLTGLVRSGDFYREAEQFLNAADDSSYCLIVIDIEHFKLYNEWYGEAAGDDFLIGIADCLKQVQSFSGGVAGYMGDDDFCILIPNRAELIEMLEHRLMGHIRGLGNNVGFLPALGIYEIEDRSVSVRTMHDRATLAMNAVKGNYAKRICWYDNAMMRKMEEDHLLLSEVQRALENEEFTFYCQPKCSMATGRIVGMESLVRWNHPERGLILPGEFIPILEQNGFIAALDCYVWERVCKCLRTWIDAGYRPLPISVNISRVDIYTINVPARLWSLVEQYDLDPALLELEITESAYAAEYNIITAMINELRAYGFTVLMDDFGSGYSSLNMLRDVNVDVLKIDMKFLAKNAISTEKGLGILEAIINMARLMGMRIIAEGVETEEQMQSLLQMGCHYGQGYYFYRPMPIEEMTELLKIEDILDYRGVLAQQIEHLNIKELFNEDMLSEAMLNNLLGGVMICEYDGESLEIVSVNEQYYRVTGENPVDLNEQRHTVLRNIYSDDHRVLFDILEQAYRNTMSGARGEIRHLGSDHRTRWLDFRAFFMREHDGRRWYYCSISDVTERKRCEHQLEASQRALGSIISVRDRDESFMSLTEENRRAAATIFAQISPGGMVGGYCEDDFPLYFANLELVRLLGYDDYEEFAAAIDHRVINMIHPDDRESVMRDIGPEYYRGLEYTTTYRAPKKDGSWFWVLDKGKVVEAEDGRLAIVSACTDISETIMAQEQLAERNAILTRQNKELHYLNNDLPGGYHRCAITDGYDFLHVSNRFLEILGYESCELTQLFDGKLLNMVHPDDRQRVDEWLTSLIAGGDSFSYEYRLLGKHGYIWVADQTRCVEYGDETLLQGTIIDVTATADLRNSLQVLGENAPEAIVLARYLPDRLEYQVVSNGFYRDMGYSPEDYERALNQREFNSQLEPADLERICRGLRKAVPQCANYRDLVRLHSHDGRKLWVDVEARYVRDEGDARVYLCTYIDVTPFTRSSKSSAEH